MFLTKADRLLSKPRIVERSGLYIWFRMLPTTKKKIIENRYRLHVLTCIKDDCLWNVQPFVIFVEEYRENAILFDEIAA